MTTRPGTAELVDRREILPGQHLLSFHAPRLAVGARAGQFIQIRPNDPARSVLLHPYPINTVDIATGIVTLHARGGGRPATGLDPLRPGDVVEAWGPLGRPFEVDPRAHHLLLVAGGLGIAGLRFLADEAIAAGRQVTLLYGAAGARDVYPSSLLPDEVEYVIATGDGSVGRRGRVTDLVPTYEAWADQAFGCGRPELLAALARLAAGRRERLGVAKLGRKRGAGRAEAAGSTAARRRAFLQVVLEQELSCAAATCLGCVVLGPSGVPQRACREGPVFASGEIDWESGWS